MNILDVYAREFLKYCDNCHFLFFNQEHRREVCERLGVKPEKLDEIITYCLDKQYANFFEPYLPNYVCPTNSGLRALGLLEEETL